MSMPAFPNIKGEPAQRLAEFILANSKTKYTAALRLTWLGMQMHEPRAPCPISFPP
jgi:hypothetical protein